MKTVDVSELEALEPSRPLMVWCTCAERNGDLYLRRIAAWRRQLSYLDADFYSFCDGEVPARDDPGDVIMVKLLPSLGRPSVCCFPGWKRSLYQALRHSMKYGFCFHVESDCLVKCRDSLRTMALDPEAAAAGWNDRYRFMETACMVFNNKGARRQAIAQYSTESSWWEHKIVERQLGWLLDNGSPLGKSVRLEHPDDVDAEDVALLCQCPPELMDRLSVKS